MKLETFSKAQLTALTWWSENSPHAGRDAIICDGAVRSGKTLCMGLGFVFWAMRCFNGARFALCGRTVTSLRRNVVSELLPALRELGFRCTERVSGNLVEIGFAGRANTFHYFGGKDESSAALIQGVTLAGVLLDEAALMPQSFVEQACARCSVAGSRFWFNCNPEGPGHWFYREWINKAEEKNALYVRFRMEDNPALTPEIVARYAKLYSGVFYRRFILGEWVAPEGIVYDFFDESYIREVPEGEAEAYAVSCDYGTANPTSFGLWGLYGGAWYRVREYYWDSRREGRQKTDGEYVDAMLELLEGRKPRFVVVDPSAASFIETLRRTGIFVRKANNDVLTGIRRTADMLRSGRLNICRPCADAIREFSLYRWDEGASGRDAPLKRDDHAMDDIRYFAMALDDDDGFFAVTAERR